MNHEQYLDISTVYLFLIGTASVFSINNNVYSTYTTYMYDAYQCSYYINLNTFYGNDDNAS